MVDIESEGKKIDKKIFNFIYENKIVKLINICLCFGVLVGKVPVKELVIIEDYGNKIGMVFQIVDDFLDIEGSVSKLGKIIGKDVVVGKVIFFVIYGVEESCQMVKDFMEKVIMGIFQLGDKSLCFWILVEYFLN